MSFKTYTTRRERHLYLHGRYLQLERLHQAKNWKWEFDPGVGHTVRVGRKWNHRRGEKFKVLCVTARTYNAFINPVWFPAAAEVIPPGPGPRRPPHVRFKFPRVWGIAPSWTHQQRGVLGYHVKRVKTRRKRPRDARNTAFARRITGCNFHYFMTGYFPDDDPLNRHPNASDVQNGENPDPTRQWPSPLGYES